MSSNNFFGGIPTGPDVNRLLAEYPIEKLTEGTLIDYECVAKIISNPVRSTRWISVTTAWRKRIENDFNVILSCDPNKKAFVVLTNGEKVELSRQKLRESAKKAKRSMIISARVDLPKLTAEERKAYDFNTAKAAAIMASAQLRNGKKALPEMARAENTGN